MDHGGCSMVVDWDEATNLFVATVPTLTFSTYGETKEKAKVKESIPAPIEGLKTVGQPIPQGITQGI